MNMSPIISKAIIQARQRDLQASADNARLVREARQANRTARESSLAARPVAKRRWRRFGLAWLFGTQ
jgi:hypothetical protein